MTIRARYIQYIQLADNYIHPKLPEISIYMSRRRGDLYLKGLSIDCTENHGCNEVITCTTLWDKDIKKTLFINNYK